MFWPVVKFATRAATRRAMTSPHSQARLASKRRRTNTARLTNMIAPGTCSQRSSPAYSAGVRDCISISSVTEKLPTASAVSANHR